MPEENWMKLYFPKIKKDLIDSFASESTLDSEERPLKVCLRCFAKIKNLIRVFPDHFTFQRYPTHSKAAISATDLPNHIPRRAQ